MINQFKKELLRQEKFDKKLEKKYKESSTGKLSDEDYAMKLKIRKRISILKNGGQVEDITFFTELRDKIKKLLEPLKKEDKSIIA